MEYPEYIDFFTTSYSPEFMEGILLVESCFNKLNYESHIDLIDAIFQREGIEPLRTLCDDAVALYRLHIADILIKQGFRLINYEETKFHIMASILYGVTLLSNTKIEDLLEGETIEEIEDDFSWGCQLLSKLTELDIMEIFAAVDYIDPYVISILNSHEDIRDTRRKNSEQSQKRFMNKLGDNKSGLVIDVVRSINYFGYSPDPILDLIADDLSLLENPEEIAREFFLLLAGSNMANPKQMVVWVNNAVENVIHQSKLAISVLNILGNLEDLSI